MKANEPTYLNVKPFQDFSKGHYRTANESIVPMNSVKLAINMDSDTELGALVSRKGTDRIGAQAVASATCYGAHYFRDTVGTSHTLFGVFTPTTTGTFTVDAGTNVITSTTHGLSNGDLIRVSSATTLPAGLTAATNYYVINSAASTFKVSATSGGTEIDITDAGTGTHTWTHYGSRIYNMATGAASLTGETSSLKTRFCTFLDSMVRVNGTDVCKAFNGSAWVTTGGAFDVANMPKGTVVMEWKDRVYTAGVSTSPNLLYYSSVADPATRTVAWTADGTETGAGTLALEQEDGGGSITALGKVPGYFLAFKERTMKRWDGSSTYPEDLINTGVLTQEAVTWGRGMCFFGNQEGVWATNGDYPQRISQPIQDLWDAIPAANMSSIAAKCTEKHVYFYVGDIAIGDNTLTNICLKYNIDAQTWDIYSYYSDFTVFIDYVDSNSKRVVLGGDKNGQLLQINTGNTDYHSTLQPITWSVESQNMDYGYPGLIKKVIAITTLTRNVRRGMVLCRVNSDRDQDWKPVSGKINDDVSEFKEFEVVGHRFNWKLTGITDTGQVKVKGFDFPDNSVLVTANVK